MEVIEGIEEMRCWRRGCSRDGDRGGFGGGDGIGNGYGEGKGKRKSKGKVKEKGKKKKRMTMKIRKMKEKGMGKRGKKEKKRKGWMREMKEENEEWEMEKEAGIGEWASGRRLFGVEKRGKERMAGWWVMREKFVRAREEWAERKSEDFVAGWILQVEE